MSRIGKKSISLPAGVSVTTAEGRVDVKGPKGALSLALHPHATVQTETSEKGDVLVVNVLDAKEDSAVWGTMRSLLHGMVLGVTTGWTKVLELNGVGYKMNLAGQKLTMSLGFSHDVFYQIPAGVTASLEGNTLTLTSIDKQLVGQVASELRSLKKPEPYKGKGFKYSDEVIRRKAGKAAKGE